MCLFTTRNLQLLQIAYFCLNRLSDSQEYFWDFNNMERHTADAIVSWLGPKQWQVGHTSDLMIIYLIKYTYSYIIGKIGKLNTHSPINCMTIIVRIDLISDTHSTEYTWQSF